MESGDRPESLESRVTGTDVESCDMDFEGMSDDFFSPEAEGEGEEEAVGSERGVPAESLTSLSARSPSVSLSTSRLPRNAGVSEGKTPSPEHSTSHPHSAKTSSSSSASPSKNKSPAKAGDPKFLSEFYSHSRLHHISTWGAEFRAYVSKLQKESGGSFEGRDRLRQFHVEGMVERGLEQTLESSKRGKPPRVIMHVDMDCFFVSVGLLSHPEHRGG